MLVVNITVVVDVVVLVILNDVVDIYHVANVIVDLIEHLYRPYCWVDGCSVSLVSLGDSESDCSDKVKTKSAFSFWLRLCAGF